MQEKIADNLLFSHRTDALAAKLGITVSELPAKTAFKQRMLHAYRSGTHPVSVKAWRKLEAAEKAAGIEIARVSEMETSPHEIVRDLPQDLRDRLFEHNLDSINSRMVQYLLNSEALAAKAMRQLEEPGNSEAAEDLGYFARLVGDEARPVRKLWKGIFEVLSGRAEGGLPERNADVRYEKKKEGKK